MIKTMKKHFEKNFTKNVKPIVFCCYFAASKYLHKPHLNYIERYKAMRTPVKWLQWLFKTFVEVLTAGQAHRLLYLRQTSKNIYKMSKNTQTPKPLRNEAVNAADVAPYKTDTIKDTLKHEENAITLAVEIDAIIGTLIDLLGCEVKSVGLSTGMISNHLFQLRRLKNLFLITAIENGKDITPVLLENANLMR